VTATKFPGDLLICGSSPGDEHDVEAGESADGNDEKADDDHDHDRDNRFGRLHLAFPFQKHVKEREAEYGKHVKGERDEEEEKETVVSFSDAIVYPWTMMVEFLNAVVANRAMRASRGTVKLTGVAPLHSDSDSSDFHVFVQRRSKVVFRNLGSLRMSSRI